MVFFDTRSFEDMTSRKRYFPINDVFIVT